MVDRTSGVPAYRQVAQVIRAQIESGELAPGVPLPSERDLVTRFDVSRPTIRDAVKLLRSQGLVVAEHGRGMFVRRPVAVTRLARNRLSRAARADDKHAFLADAAVATFTPSVSVLVHFEPADERTARGLQIEPGTEVTVRDRVMRADGSAVQLAVSRLPQQSVLQLPEGTPVITVTRIAYTADSAVEVNDMVLAADRYELHYQLPAE